MRTEDYGKIGIHGSNNYLPFLAKEERERLEAELSISSDRTDLENFFNETQILQRHLVGNSTEWQLNALTWLKEVRLETK